MRNLFCIQTSPRCGSNIWKYLGLFIHPAPPTIPLNSSLQRWSPCGTPLMRKLSPWRSAGIARYTPSAKVAMFCFLCERKLIFQFFYSFWNSPPGLDMWRGGKVHGRVEDEPGDFSSSNTIFSLETYRWPIPAQWSWRSSWPTRWFQNQRAAFLPLGTVSLTRGARTPRLGAGELRFYC